MPVSAGTKLGPYEITSPLGAGGMGEVWKARDSRLGRDVAIKIGREQFSERFEREARAVAALNHSNICQLYDVGPNYLVMEFVDGEAWRGPLAPAEALPIVEQLIDGIETAHEKGIVHRDLKPANIKITPQGRVKILDFGLAKAAEPERAANPDNSPTLSMEATRVGMILGTAAYMSPEQARGKPADRRSDIWSFGVVVYELVTGKRLFQGEDISEILAAVIKEEPNLDAAPAELRRLLRACLQKDPNKRLQAIGDARLLLAEPPPVPIEVPTLRLPWVPWLVTGVVAILAALGWVKALQREPAGTGEKLTLSIVPPSGTALAQVGGLNVDRISPDGSAVLLRTSDGKFRIRSLNNLEVQPIAPINPTGDAFWAPDSKSIAVPTVNGLVKIHLPDGAPELISSDSVAAARGGSWSERGTILLSKIDSSPDGIGLYEVPAGGGRLSPITVSGLRNGRSYAPEFLPGGEDFLFAFAPFDSSEMEIYWATLREGKAVNTHLLFKNDTAPQFTPAAGGRVLFVRNDNLYAQKVDLTAGKIGGDPELVQRHVVSNPAERNANFSVSRSGALAWRSGTAIVSEAAIFDRKGNRIGTAGSAVPVDTIRLSPDETHLLAQSEAAAWILETSGLGRIASPITTGATLWAPDGSHFITTRGTEIGERAVNNSGEYRRLAAIPPLGSRSLFLNDVSGEGGGILYGEQTGLFLLHVNSGRAESQQLVNQRVDNAALSPDGTWIVYSPRAEPGVYVQPLRGPGFRKQIAASGNLSLWRKDGKEILYYDQERIWSVRVNGSGDQLRFAEPAALFPVARPMGLNSSSRPLAANQDASRIYFLQSADQPDSGVINVRVNAIR